MVNVSLVFNEFVPVLAPYILQGSLINLTSRRSFLLHLFLNRLLIKVIMCHFHKIFLRISKRGHIAFCELEILLRFFLLFLLSLNTNLSKFLWLFDILDNFYEIILQHRSWLTLLLFPTWLNFRKSFYGLLCCLYRRATYEWTIFNLLLFKLFYQLYVTLLLALLLFPN